MPVGHSPEDKHPAHSLLELLTGRRCGQEAVRVSLLRGWKEQAGSTSTDPSHLMKRGRIQVPEPNCHGGRGSTQEGTETLIPRRC